MPDDVEQQLMALLLAQVLAERERLIRDLTDATAQAALDRLVRELAAEKPRRQRGGMGSR
jgi:hypothetical protein